MKRFITLFIFAFSLIVGTGNLLNAQAPWCTPTWTNTGSNWQMGTQYVQIGTISNTSGTPTTVAPYSDYTSMSTTTAPGGVVPFNIQIGTGYYMYVCIYIDWNNDYTFNTTDEKVYASSVPINASAFVAGSFTVPCSATSGSKRMRVISTYGGSSSPTPCGPNAYAGEAEDYTLIVGTGGPMTYDSAYARHTDTTAVFFGQIKTKILQLNVKTSGSPCVNILKVDSLFISTTGSTNPADITNLRIYSQDADPLNDAYLLGTIPNPSGKIKIAPTGGFTLGAGVNSVMIAYDISANATVGHIVDCSFDSLYIGGVKRIPTTRNPVGKRRIVHQANFNGYCSVTRNYLANYAIGIKKVKFESINNATQTWPGPAIYNFYSSPIPTVYMQKTYSITINHGELNPQAAAVYIDWDNDGYFNSAGENVINFLNKTEGSVSSGTFSIPCNALPGIHRMRVSSDIGGSQPLACGLINYGEVEDYLIYVPAQGTPTVSYTKKDTVGYIGSQVVLTPRTNIDGNISFNWDYDNNGTWDQTATLGTTTYFTAGYKKIRLQATLNGCTQTYFSNIFIDSVKIKAPSQPPAANFIANLNVVTTSIPVNLTDLTTLGPNHWKWKITPDSFQGYPAYVILPNDTTQNIQILFNALGDYTVRLITSNIIGADTEIKLKYIKVVKEMLMCVDNESRLTTGYLYDPGGKYANYPNPTTVGPNGAEGFCYFLIHPKCATAITLNFLDFDVCSYGITSCTALDPDNVKIFDGSTTNGTALNLGFLDMLGQPLYPKGFMNGPNNLLMPLPPSTTATSGSMLVVWHVNCAAVAAGFEARWTTQLFSPNPPHAHILGTDTIYTGKKATFHSTSTGYDLDYQWDFNNDNIIDSYDSAATFVFSSPGIYHPRLIITSCEFKDTANYVVVVRNPTAVPKVAFIADFVRVTKNDKVILTDLSDNTVYAWKWRFTPNKVSFVDGTDSTSQNPHLKFTDTGYFDVRLYATNALGTRDSLKKKYILVYKPCTPMVLNKNSDLGMSEVILKDVNQTKIIDQVSQIGVSAYTDYSFPNKAQVYQRGTYELTLKRNTNFNNVTWTAWIDYNQNGIFETNESVGFVSNTNLTTWSVNITIPATAIAGNAVMRIAANTGILLNSGCGPNFTGEFEDYGLVISKDVIKPIITLTAPDTVTISSCGTYTEPGYAAWDMVNGNLTPSVAVAGTINSLIPGFYYKTYNVSDLSGNAAIQKTRVIHILRDFIPPTIVLKGKNPDSVAVGSAYTDPGHTTTDDCAGVASDSVINAVNINKVGVFNITYKARDKSVPYNQKIVTRQVVVYDKIDPTLTLNGANPFYLEVNTPFVDPGDTITDNYYKGLTATITGTVDNTKLGSYFLTYCITDPSGNGPVCKDRLVIVQDKTAPTITLLGSALTLVDVQTEYIEPGYTVTDNYWSAGDVITKISGNVNTFVLGDYILTYQAIDASGNISAIIQRTVRVVDRVAPTIELVGETSMAVQRWGKFIDPGISVHDNYYPDNSLIIHANESGTYENALTPGLFTYTYKVCDPSGNCSGEITRLIYIYETQKSLGIPDENGYRITYYPNPANNELNVSIDLPDNMPVNISMYDAVGKNVMTVYKGKTKTASYKLDISNLNSGVYYIKFTINGTDINKKFVISR